MNFEAGSANPIAPGKYITAVKTTTDLCNKQNSKSNFLIKILTDIFENSTNVKVKCPMEKNVYQMKNLLVDANKLIPKSLAFPANVSAYGEFLTKSNSSSRKVFILSVKLLVDIKK